MVKCLQTFCPEDQNIRGSGMWSSISTPTQFAMAIVLWLTNVFSWLSGPALHFDLEFACVLGATVSVIVLCTLLATNLEQLGMIKKKPSQSAISEFQKKLRDVEIAKQVALNRVNRSSTSAAANCLETVSRKII